MQVEHIEGPIRGLNCYPVKGLSACPLAEVDLMPGATMPLDRAWAIEEGVARFDASDPKHLSKVAFLMLMRYPALAALRTSVDPDSRELTLRRGPMEVLRAGLETAEGSEAIAAFFTEYLAPKVRGPLRVVHAPGHSFSDVAIKCLHIVNLASVRALERALGETVDPARFRANVIVDLPLPWAEFSWVGQEISLGDARLEVLEPTERCAAVNAAPGSGKRDVNILAALDRGFGHRDMGVYATVSEAGRVRTGDSISGPRPGSQ